MKNMMSIDRARSFWERSILRTGSTQDCHAPRPSRKSGMTKSELQRLFARELGYSREISTEM